jgi:hypothetical protein
MRASIGAVAVIGIALLFSEATAAPPKTLHQKLQGVWSRSNYDVTYKIEGKQCLQVKKNQPLKIFASGILVFPVGKDYAEVKLDNGYTLWWFSAGNDTAASDDFDPNGVLAGTGNVYYRVKE